MRALRVARCRPRDVRPSRENALRREPLVHFLVLAALLFVAHPTYSTPSAREPIVIERASIDELARRQEELLAWPLSDEERGALVEFGNR